MSAILSAHRAVAELVESGREGIFSTIRGTRRRWRARSTGCATAEARLALGNDAALLGRRFGARVVCPGQSPGAGVPSRLRRAAPADAAGSP